MTIEGVNVGGRSTPAKMHPQWWVSAGMSMSGAIVRQDFGVREDPVICTFALMEKTTLDSLLAALDAVKPGGYLTVVPDSGDDLGIGATSSVELIFDDIETEYVSGDRWSVVLSMRKVA